LFALVKINYFHFVGNINIWRNENCEDLSS